MKIEYDIAISFAGEQRPIAKRINDVLKENGISTFYDEDKIVELWGKNLAEHLPTIYSETARFVLLILSEEYLNKVWTKVERRAAISRMIRSSNEYVLIYKVGDVCMENAPGLSRDTAYISDSLKNPEEVALLIMKKLGLSYSLEELKSVIPDIANKRLLVESNEKQFQDGFVPYITLRNEVYQHCRGVDLKIIEKILYDFLNSQVNRGLYEYYGGAVSGYRIPNKS